MIVINGKHSLATFMPYLHTYTVHIVNRAGGLNIHILF